MKKVITILASFAMAITILGFLPAMANAQMCSYTLYVNGAQYSASASYATSGQLTYSGNTITLNNFYGKSIAAVPGGDYDDDDAPEITIVVKGSNTLTGSSTLTGTSYEKHDLYSCIYAEPRSGGSGKDSIVNISGTGTLNLGKQWYDFSKSDTADYSAIKAGAKVNISGGVTINVGYTIEGLSDTSKTIAGIEAADVNVTNSVLKITLNGKTYYPSQYSSQATKTTAPIYAVNGNLTQSGSGYTSVDTTAGGADSTEIVCVKGNITLASANAAVYLKTKKNKTIQASGYSVKNQYPTKIGKYSVGNLASFDYDAYVPYLSTENNTSLSNISYNDIYKYIKFGTKGNSLDDDSAFSDSGKGFYKYYTVEKVAEDGNSTSPNDEIYKTSNTGDSIYKGYLYIVPAPGYRMSSDSTWYSTLKSDVKSVTGFTPDDVRGFYNQGIMTATYCYPDLEITTQPPIYFCRNSEAAIKMSIAEFTKSALTDPDSYNPEIIYEWHLKATENGTTSDFLFSELGIASGTSTDTLTIDKSKITDASVTINGSNVKLSDLDKMTLYCVVKAISGQVKTIETIFDPLSHIAAGTKIFTKAGIGTTGVENTLCGACNKTIDTTEIAAIKDSTIKLAKTSYTYTGKAIKPTVYAKDTTGASIASACRSVTYKNCTKVGTASATITFRVAYTGTKKLTYKILPKQATIKSATPGTRKITLKMGTKVSSTGGTKYQIRYRIKGTSTWKTKATTSQTITLTSLKKGKKYEIKVRAYTGSCYGAYSKATVTKAVK